MLIDQIEGSGKTPEGYKSEEFIEGLFQVAKDPEGGLDGNVRFATLVDEEFCPDKTEQKILKVDVGPILLAIKAGNTTALKDILENLRGNLAKNKIKFSPPFYNQGVKTLNTELKNFATEL